MLLMEKLTFRVADIVISTNESYKKLALDRSKKKSDEVFVVRNNETYSYAYFNRLQKKAGDFGGDMLDKAKEEKVVSKPEKKEVKKD